MKLTGAAFQKIQTALADAFISSSEFEMIARCMDMQLSDVVNPNERLPHIMLKLIERAERNDAVSRLIECAQSQNPANRKLGALTTADIEAAARSEDVVSEGDGAAAFKIRLVAAVHQLDTPGMEVLAAHELAELLSGANEAEAQTHYLVMLGMVRVERPSEVGLELTRVFAESLKRQLARADRAAVNLSLTRVRLPRAELADLDLHEADLAFAQLPSATLKNSNLWRSRAYGIDVSKAGISRSNLEEARWHAAVARGTRFHDCRMISAFFKDADLADAEFQRARLQGAHFERANLEGAQFEQANVADADFREARIDDAAAASLAKAASRKNARLDPEALELVEKHAAG